MVFDVSVSRGDTEHDEDLEMEEIDWTGYPTVCREMDSLLLIVGLSTKRLDLPKSSGTCVNQKRYSLNLMYS